MNRKIRKDAANFIRYNGQYWLTKLYDAATGSWFAFPINHVNKSWYVEPRCGQWCSRNEGAKLDNPTSVVRYYAYSSWLKHLQCLLDSCRFVGRGANRIKSEIHQFEELSKSAPH